MQVVFWYSIVVFGIVLLDGVRTIVLRPSRGIKNGIELSNISRGISVYPTDVCMSLWKSFDKGRIGLLHGQYDYTITTHGEPRSVWISEGEVGPAQVCGSDGMNTFGVTKLPTGFIVHADVVTDHTELLWEVLF